jgi:hypothetical protein
MSQELTVAIIKSGCKIERQAKAILSLLVLLSENKP